MAVRKTAQVTSKKAELKVKSDAKIDKKTTKQAKKGLKKAGTVTLLIVSVCLVLGVLAGYGTYEIVSRNDCFDLIGNDKITLTLDEKYTEQGVKIIEFGNDISENVQYETNLKVEGDSFYAEDIGTYYIKYKVDSFKFGKLFGIERVRSVTFVEASEGGE